MGDTLPVSVPIDKIIDTIANCNKYTNQQIIFEHSQEIPNLADTELTITTPIDLVFNFDDSFSCKNIHIKDCSVKIANLNMFGSIHVENGALTLTNSRIHDPQPNQDYIISCTRVSQVFADNCIFENTDHFGVCADDGSLIKINGCIIKNVKLFGTAFTAYSTFYATNSTFTEIGLDEIFLENQSSATCRNCLFEKSKKRAFSASNKSSVTVDNCFIKNCQLGALYAGNCEKVLVFGTKISDCDYSAIYLEHTTAAIKHTTITNCNGNGVNAAHYSKILIHQCNITKTTYPPIAVCENSFSLIQKCNIHDSGMSGIIVRSRSQATIENCSIVRSNIYGICVSDSKGVSLKNTLIVNSKEAALCVYNHSHAIVKNSHLIGPTKIGFNVFCGGCVSSLNTSIFGITEHCCWIHHSGSGSFINTIVDLNELQQHDDVLAAIQEIESNEGFGLQDIPTEKLVKIDSKRPVVFQRSFGDSKKALIITKNPDENLPKYGIEATAPTCKICGKDSTDCHFSICAHSVYCKKCWNSLANKPELCELCLMPIESVITPIDCSPEEEEETNENPNIDSQTNLKLNQSSNLEKENSPEINQNENDNENQNQNQDQNEIQNDETYNYEMTNDDEMNNDDNNNEGNHNDEEIIELENKKENNDDENNTNNENRNHGISEISVNSNCGSSLNNESILNNKENNEKIKIEKIFVKKKKNKICSICYSYKVDSLIVPCGHTICHKCSEKWFETSSECPFCRENGCRSRRYVSYE
ncbi:hypothetical protein TRFO_35804 [Tritrichomonas foetus]|uniref:RING-type domain-containing protein n=1 Tax=Tritrichomonas foetus TaxID=1144522 RepID=A0A1J4JI10_9EUKA|nr:hypothetical protein TRFO_35804 [Tritrichomonas foetus]|eukprot:OHS97895.1 hypothetical protein TRFO_35804 [Tritrichomonas foetus]